MNRLYTMFYVLRPIVGDSESTMYTNYTKYGFKFI